MSRSKRQQRRAHLHGQPTAALHPALIGGGVVVLAIGVLVGVVVVQTFGGLNLGATRTQAATTNLVQQQAQYNATATASAQTQNAMPRVDLAEAKRLYDTRQAIMVDARSVADFNIGHIQGAVNISMYEVEQRVNLLPEDRESQIITYCSCPAEEEAGVVLHKLNELGYNNVRALKGGLPLWVQNRYPVEQPK